MRAWPGGPRLYSQDAFIHILKQEVGIISYIQGQSGLQAKFQGSQCCSETLSNSLMK